MHESDSQVPNAILKATDTAVWKQKDDLYFTGAIALFAVRKTVIKLYPFWQPSVARF